MSRTIKEGYKETEIGVLPVEWEVVKLEDILTIKYGKNQKSVEDKNGDYPILGTGGLMGYANDFLYSKPSVLIGRKGTIDKPMYMDKPFWTVDTLFYSDIKSNTLPLWLFYIFQTINWKKYNEASGVPSLSVQNIHNISTVLPPLKEQQKIAKILSTTDEKIEAISSQIEKAETVKKGLLQKLLSEGIGHSEFKESELGRIPESWEVVKVQELIDNKILKSVQDGNHGEIHPKASDYVDEGIPFVMANNISEYQYSNLRIGHSFSGDVLLTHKATIGLTAIVPPNTKIMLTPQVTAYSICNQEKLSNFYLYYYFQSSSFQNKLKIYSKQSTRSYIGITAQKNLLVKIPHFKEQQKISQILSTSDEKIELLKVKKEKYETLKKGLLQKLLSGEIRV